ncbi:MAG: hypothetical protein UX09_C0015G0023 [Candidatus Uhrbacteria bacterium GW2011_GWE2_45_35]|uniref:Uncharacterized protein n=2 Tax=Candidatus Uhriibacteriota TaxID=1752732 RepID=A0A0G1LRI0_9BACT|nr:MAG: hypothetical protein UW63_C0017G0017 [Candidatus Uhrbacteria bacterium GW2011_GWF2_44_350]KKU08636.1 MAG: hypothetical protein UX09_C0015G0023 [Candidatus Uhrbacteria bacterium GW2011_GWE2_45_35]HBR80285.1 hypothetical protein [Candidatus Uhrbacteria bacterium]HCU31587.1 hypothetical protein [Candidatus Uhrbacteria bacterium]
MNFPSFFAKLSPVKRESFFSLFKKYPDLIIPTIDRVERKIEAVKQKDTKKLEAIFLEEKQMIQNITDRLDQEAVKHKIKKDIS